MIRGKMCFWVAAIVICVADLTTKTMVFEKLGISVAQYETTESWADTENEWRRRWNRPTELLLGDQDGNYVRFVAMMNPGMMWGSFSEYAKFLMVFRWLAVLVILYLLYGMEPEQKFGQLALGGILGGALGNIHDSMRYAGVRDFLEVNLGFGPFDPFPAFNVADSAICVGVAILALGLLRPGAGASKGEPESAPQES